jgi:hypothetical protein
MSRKSSRLGMEMDLRAKYGITRKAATGRSKTEPFSSQMMYAPPLLMIGELEPKVVA